MINNFYICIEFWLNEREDEERKYTEINLHLLFHSFNFYLNSIKDSLTMLTMLILRLVEAEFSS